MTLSPSVHVLHDEHDIESLGERRRREIEVLMALRWVRAMIPVSRSREPALVLDSIDATFRVLPGDLDMLMHTTNARYLSILDAARISYLTRTGLWRWCGIKMTCKPRCA
ncbi:thioesterase family protein [Rhodococcus sp. 05-2254-3]|uniref:thioesterase family protein n=2 Tax=Rhodococcus TaxID=1827 RepID=UPI001594F4C3|nr:thioesterase family protein [Rhodococcus sp. 05-2254-3]